MKTDLEHLVSEYRRRRDWLEPFDVNCWLGTPLEPAFTSIDGIGEFKAALTRRGIRRAVVSHTMCVRHGAMEGNRELLQSIRGERDLTPAATLVPEMAGPGGWPQLLRSMIGDGVRLVRLFPHSHNFLLDGRYLDGMLEAIQEARLPLMIWHTQTTWPTLGGLCEKYPELPVIVDGTGRKLCYDNRIYYPFLQRFPNLFLETHNLTNYLGLDDLVSRFGSRRFIFGSYFPHLDPNSSTMPIRDGRMKEDDQQDIAHGNLERLLAEVRV